MGLLGRGVQPGWLLYPGTVLAAAAIALMNVLLPSLVKRRQPDRAGLLIGVYLLSLAAGSVLASLVAVPMFQASNGSIPLALGAMGAARRQRRRWRGCRSGASGRCRPEPCHAGSNHA